MKKRLLFLIPTLALLALLSACPVMPAVPPQAGDVQFHVYDLSQFSYAIYPAQIGFRVYLADATTKDRVDSIAITFPDGSRVEVKKANLVWKTEDGAGFFYLGSFANVYDQDVVALGDYTFTLTDSETGAQTSYVKALKRAGLTASYLYANKANVTPAIVNKIDAPTCSKTPDSITYSWNGIDSRIDGCMAEWYEGVNFLGLDSFARGDNWKGTNSYLNYFTAAADLSKLADLDTVVLMFSFWEADSSNGAGVCYWQLSDVEVKVTSTP